jgi:hypothetical protein
MLPKTTEEVKIVPMQERKPNHDRNITIQELLTAVCEHYGDPETPASFY